MFLFFQAYTLWCCVLGESDETPRQPKQPSERVLFNVTATLHVLPLLIACRPTPRLTLPGLLLLLVCWSPLSSVPHCLWFYVTRIGCRRLCERTVEGWMWMMMATRWDATVWNRWIWPPVFRVSMRDFFLFICCCCSRCCHDSRIGDVLQMIIFHEQQQQIEQTVPFVGSLRAAIEAQTHKYTHTHVKWVWGR